MYCPQRRSNPLLLVRHALILGLPLFFLLLARTAAAQGLQVFFGSLHAHTSYSDGSGTPEEAYASARAAGLDFYAITEHNHSSAEFGISSDDPRKDGLLIATMPTLYHGRGDEGTVDSALVPTAERLTIDGEFIALYGQEFSSISKGNHINVFDVPEVIDVPNGAFDEFLEWRSLTENFDSSGRPALILLNHPATPSSPDEKEYGRDDFESDSAWRDQIDAAAQLICLMNGPSHSEGTGLPAPAAEEDEIFRYLELGFHVAPTGDHDTHFRNWGTVTDTRTAVIATELTKAAILEAMRNRHVYATQDRNLEIIVKVNGNLCGDRVPAPEDEDLSIAMQIRDSDEPEAEYEIEVLSGSIGGDPIELLASFEVEPGDGEFELQGIRYVGGYQFFLFRVIQFGNDHEDFDMAWTAPIWFEPEGEMPEPFEDESQFVASRNSSIYHVDPECADAKRIKEENRVTGSAAREGRERHPVCPR